MVQGRMSPFRARFNPFPQRPPKTLGEARNRYPKFFTVEFFETFHDSNSRQRQIIANDLNKLGIYTFWSPEYEIWVTNTFRPRGITPRNLGEARLMYPRYFDTTKFEWFLEVDAFEQDRFKKELSKLGIKPYWLQSYEQYVRKKYPRKQPAARKKPDMNWVAQDFVPDWQRAGWNMTGNITRRPDPRRPNMMIIYYEMIWKRGGRVKKPDSLEGVRPPEFRVMTVEV